MDIIKDVFTVETDDTTLVGVEIIFPPNQESRSIRIAHRPSISSIDHVRDGFMECYTDLDHYTQVRGNDISRWQDKYFVISFINSSFFNI